MRCCVFCVDEDEFIEGLWRIIFEHLCLRLNMRYRDYVKQVVLMQNRLFSVIYALIESERFIELCHMIAQQAF